MSYLTHPDAIEELRESVARTRRLLLLPPDISINQWAEAFRRLPASSGRPGPFVPDPIPVEIQNDCCNPDVHEVAFMKAARLGWSEIANNAMGWGTRSTACPCSCFSPAGTRRRCTPRSAWRT